MVGLIIGAAILGIVIAIMEEGEFPGWGKMILCVLAGVIPAAILNRVLPKDYFFIGILIGAVCATFAIMATCAMGLKRAGIAAGVFFVAQLLLSFIL